MSSVSQAGVTYAGVGWSAEFSTSLEGEWTGVGQQCLYLSRPLAHNYWLRLACCPHLCALRTAYPLLPLAVVRPLPVVSAQLSIPDGGSCLL